YGAKGDGLNDDTYAIEAATAAHSRKLAIYFPPGVYLHKEVTKIRGFELIIFGNHAHLVGTNPNRSAALIEGSRITLLDLTVISAAQNSRGDRDEQSGIMITGDNIKVIRTTVLDSKSAGIFVKGGQHFAIFNNFVANTKADGVHATDRAYDGR